MLDAQDGTADYDLETNVSRRAKAARKGKKMNDPVKVGPQSLEDEWSLWSEQVLSAIHAGYLDTQLKSIAEACIDRNKRLKDKTAETREPKASPPFPILMTDAARASEPAPKQNKAVTNAKPAKKAVSVRRRRPTSDTFRFTDGKLYEKSDVKGRTMKYRDEHGGVYMLKITGVGDRSAKVEFIDRALNKVTDGPFVPSNYAGKDPIFMHVSTIQSIIDTIKPVKE